MHTEFGNYDDIYKKHWLTCVSFIKASKRLKLHYKGTFFL